MNQRIFLSTISNHSFKWKNLKNYYVISEYWKDVLYSWWYLEHILMQPDREGVSYSFTKHNFHLRVPPFSSWCSEYIPLQLDSTCFVHSWIKHRPSLAAVPSCRFAPVFLVMSWVHPLAIRCYLFCTFMSKTQFSFGCRAPISFLVIPWAYSPIRCYLFGHTFMNKAQFDRAPVSKIFSSSFCNCW